MAAHPSGEYMPTLQASCWANPTIETPLAETFRRGHQTGVRPESQITISNNVNGSGLI